MIDPPDIRDLDGIWQASRRSLKLTLLGSSPATKSQVRNGSMASYGVHLTLIRPSPHVPHLSPFIEVLLIISHERTKYSTEHLRVNVTGVVGACV